MAAICTARPATLDARAWGCWAPVLSLPTGRKLCSTNRRVIFGKTAYTRTRTQPPTVGHGGYAAGVPARRFSCPESRVAARGSVDAWGPCGLRLSAGGVGERHFRGFPVLCLSRTRPLPDFASSCTSKTCMRHGRGGSSIHSGIFSFFLGHGHAKPEPASVATSELLHLLRG